MARKPQRTELELPSGSTATIRKATARDMREAEDANFKRQRSNLAAMNDDEMAALDRLGRGRQTGEVDDPDRALLERHDAETLVDRCTISVDSKVSDKESWFDILDADDHAALFECIMWFSRVRPSKKAS